MKKIIIFGIATYMLFAFSHLNYVVGADKSRVTLKTVSSTDSFKLVWSDEFNESGFPDPVKWDYEDGYIRNSELQYYTRNSNNIRQNEGNLEITVRKEPTNGYNYSSASITTLGKSSWTYGKIEGRFKMPLGKGLWPCFWTMGANYKSLGWPQCGELDIFEHINNENVIHSTAHWADRTGKHVSSYHDSGILDVTQWHTYSIEWTPTAIKWFVDSVQHHSMSIINGANNTHAFHLPQYVLINLPIGGSWPGAPDASTVLPATMYCDYLKVYEWVPSRPLDITAIDFVISTMSVPIDRNLQLSPVVIPYNAADKNLKWESSDNTIATVCSSGIVKGIKVGTVTIKASSTLDSNIVSTCEVTVTEGTSPFLQIW